MVISKVENEDLSSLLKLLLIIDQEKRINPDLKQCEFFNGVDWDILDDFMQTENGLPFPIDDEFD